MTDPAPRRAAAGDGPLRIVSDALVAALRHPGVWLLGWLLITVPAVLGVAPVALALDDALAHNPGASTLLDQALDLDFARRHPAAVVSLASAGLFVLLAFAGLAGGILGHVGCGRRARWPEFFASAAAGLPRNLRALLIGSGAAVLLTWGCAAFDDRLREHWLYGVDPGANLLGARLLTVEAGLEALRYLYGALFLALVMTGKVAMARMAERGGRSALVAWLAAGFGALRHPLRLGLVTAGLAVLWLGGSHAVGMATARLLEVERVWWAGLLAGQLGVLWTMLLVVASFVAARRLARA